MAQEQKKVVKVTIPIDKLVSYCVHGPHVIVGKDAREKNKAIGLEDSFPLYARDDREGYEGRSAQWLSKVEKVYNSPRNIRSLYITTQGVQVRYWTTGPMKDSNGKTTYMLGDISKVYHYSNVPVGAIGVNMPQEVFGMYITKILTAALRDIMPNAGTRPNVTGDMVRRDTYRNFGGSGNPIVLNYKGIEYRVSVSGSVGKAIGTGWVMPNLEYFYIDDMIRYNLDDDYLNKLDAVYARYSAAYWLSNDTINDLANNYRNGDNGFRLSEGAIKLRQGNGQGGNFYPFPLLTALKDKNKAGSSEARFVATMIGDLLISWGRSETTKIFDKNGCVTGYPRLKHVGVINAGFASWIREKGKTPGEFWNYGVNPIFLAGDPNKARDCKCFFVNFPQNPYNLPFSTMRVWKFDNNFLVTQFEAINNRIKERAVNAMEGAIVVTKVAEPGVIAEEAEAQSSKTEEPSKLDESSLIEPSATSEFEVTFNKILLETGVKNCQKVLEVYKMTETPETMQEWLDSCTPKGKALYSKLLHMEA